MAQASDEAAVHALLEQLLSLPPAQRRAALDAACVDRPALRQRVQHLLALAADQHGFLDRPPLLGAGDLGAAGDDPQHAAGRCVGAYRLLRPLGAGGMAEVWLAERVEGGFRQQVAIKLIAHAPGRAAERFAAEREILAALTHPGIARFLDGGVTADGLGWMAMEYVQGEHLTAWCRTRAASLGQRLELFLQVCDAVAYAHTRLVVHRDLKPSNILVTADGQVRLLDFGIAKLLEAAVPGTEVAAGQATATLQLSPSYAAPEQLGGQVVGTATDAYALGVVLFELLTGRLPWDDQGTPLVTAMRRLADTLPPAPSRSVGADGPVPARALRGDLDAIVARALRREPDKRYPDARALADDLRRYLGHRPVQARSGARGYVARRALRRHWRGLALVAVAFVAMSASLGAVAWQAREAQREAERRAAVQAFMVDVFRSNSSQQPDPVKARRTTARELLDIGARRIATRMDAAPENKLALLRLFGDLYYDLGLLDDADRLRRQVLALSRRLHGEGSPDSIDDLVALARVNDAATGRSEFAPQLASALAVLDRQGDTQSFRRGRLLATAAALDNSKDPPRALGEARQAVAILDRYPPSAELADALRLLGMGLLYTGDIDAALPPLRRAVDLAVRTQGARGSRLSLFHFQLAQAEYTALRFDAADAEARKALALAPNGEATVASDRIRAETLMLEIQTRAGRLRQAVASAAQLKAEFAAMTIDTDGPSKAYAMAAASQAELFAGDPQAALADAQEAVRLYRVLDANGVHLAAALSRQAQALIERGEATQARQTLEELAGYSRRIRNPRLDDALATQEIRLALDDGRLAQARARFAGLPPPAGDGAAAALAAIERDLLGARIAVAAGDASGALRLATGATARARASALAPSLSGQIAEGEWLEGLARLRSGDAAAARQPLADALARRSAQLLPTSPKIAQAQLALAECALAQGERSEAAALLAKAEAIFARHPALATPYRQPAAQLRARLGRA